MASTAAFTGMATLIKLVSDRFPIGEITFFRSFFALIPVLIWVAWRGRLGNVMYTSNFGGHILRSVVGVTSMFLGFAALARLPLADATAIGYATPLLTVIFAALLLGEVVRIYRWSAVIVGLVGVLIIIVDFLAPGVSEQPERSFTGALLGLSGAFFSGLAAIQIRRLVETEPAATIVVYFCLFASAVSLLTLPFGWVVPSPADAVILLSMGICGGIGQVLMTLSYRYADASVLAPFDYTSMLWAILISIFVFHYLPTPLMLVGTAIVVASGLFVVYREHRLGIVRKSKTVQPPPPPLT